MVFLNRPRRNVTAVENHSLAASTTKNNDERDKEAHRYCAPTLAMRQIQESSGLVSTMIGSSLSLLPRSSFKDKSTGETHGSESTHEEAKQRTPV